MTDPNPDDPMNELLQALGTKESSTTSAPVAKPPKDSYVNKLVGEGKQFKDIEAVAKSKLDADEYIKQLHKEKKEVVDQLKVLEQEKDTKAALTDVLNELRNRPSNENGSTPPAISDDEIARKVRAQFETYDLEKTRKANLATANATLLKRFNGDGDAAKNYIASRLGDLNLSGGTVRELAQTSPTAFIELFGLVKKDSNQTTNLPEGNKMPDIDSERNNKYYQKLLKEMGVSKFYGNKLVMNQREQDLKRLGDTFFN